MSTYIDPATALHLAHASREAEIRAAELHHLAREMRPDRPRRRRGGEWRLVWHRPAVAH
jgi:hypothetical protein